jgi:hypothetical protein
MFSPIPFFIACNSVGCSYLILSVDNEKPFLIDRLEPVAPVDLAPGEDKTLTVVWEAGFAAHQLWQSEE